jgi:hypothetical protein
MVAREEEGDDGEGEGKRREQLFEKRRKSWRRLGVRTKDKVSVFGTGNAMKKISVYNSTRLQSSKSRGPLKFNLIKASKLQKRLEKPSKFNR